VVVDHPDGWSSWYMHLNNDSYNSDDGRGNGVRPDLEIGDEVAAGELIGWVGDSGNAETTPPHLHFELHDTSGQAVDAYPSLVAADERGRRAFETDPVKEVLTAAPGEVVIIDLVANRVEEGTARPEFLGAYVDDDGLTSELAFDRLTALGVAAWCDDWGVRVCPDEPITGSDAESWITTLLGSSRDPSVAISYDTAVLDPSLDRSGVVICGVTTLCPAQPATYGEVAAMLIGSSDGESVLTPGDATSQLSSSGVAVCSGPQSSDRLISRAEFAGIMLQLAGADIDPSACAKLS
jgi:murein DD-endopeptidase MepM/ murein hydrolase activator NlpD